LNPQKDYTLIMKACGKHVGIRKDREK